MTAKMSNLEELPDRVDRIEQKLDRFAASVDKRFGEVDKRFGEVDGRFGEVSEAIAEQRRYTEFAFERLDRKVTSMDSKIDEVLRLLRP